MSCRGKLQCGYYTEHGRYGLTCLYAETVECMSSAGSVWYLVVQVMFRCAEQIIMGCLFLVHSV